MPAIINQGFSVLSRTPIDSRYAYTQEPWLNPNIVTDVVVNTGGAANTAGTAATHLAYPGLIAVDTTNDNIYILIDISRVNQESGWMIIGGGATGFSLSEEFDTTTSSTFALDRYDSNTDESDRQVEIILDLANDPEIVTLFNFIDGGTRTTVAQNDTVVVPATDATAVPPVIPTIMVLGGTSVDVSGKTLTRGTSRFGAPSVRVPITQADRSGGSLPSSGFGNVVFTRRIEVIETLSGHSTLAIVNNTSVSTLSADISNNVLTLTTSTDTSKLDTDLGNTSVTTTQAGTFRTAIGLGNVDNTSDASKPISTATQTALNAKQDTIPLFNRLVHTYELIGNETITIPPLGIVVVPDGPIGSRELLNTSDEARNVTQSGTTVTFATGGQASNPVGIDAAVATADWELVVPGNYTSDNAAGWVRGSDFNYNSTAATIDLPGHAGVPLGTGGGAQASASGTTLPTTGNRTGDVFDLTEQQIIAATTSTHSVTYTGTGSGFTIGVSGNIQLFDLTPQEVAQFDVGDTVSVVTDLADSTAFTATIAIVDATSVTMSVTAITAGAGVVPDNATVVYSVEIQAQTLIPGTYLWNGTSWELIVSTSLVRNFNSTLVSTPGTVINTLTTAVQTEFVDYFDAFQTGDMVNFNNKDYLYQGPTDRAVLQRFVTEGHDYAYFIPGGGARLWVSVDSRIDEVLLSLQQDINTRTNEFEQRANDFTVERINNLRSELTNRATILEIEHEDFHPFFSLINAEWFAPGRFNGIAYDAPGNNYTTGAGPDGIKLTNPKSGLYLEVTLTKGFTSFSGTASFLSSSGVVSSTLRAVEEVAFPTNPFNPFINTDGAKRTVQDATALLGNNFPSDTLLFVREGGTDVYRSTLPGDSNFGDDFTSIFTMTGYGTEANDSISNYTSISSRLASMVDPAIGGVTDYFKLGLNELGGQSNHSTLGEQNRITLQPHQREFIVRDFTVDATAAGVAEVTGNLLAPAVEDWHGLVAIFPTSATTDNAYHPQNQIFIPPLLYNKRNVNNITPQVSGRAYFSNTIDLSHQSNSTSGLVVGDAGYGQEALAETHQQIYLPILPSLIPTDIANSDDDVYISFSYPLADSSGTFQFFARVLSYDVVGRIATIFIIRQASTDGYLSRNLIPGLSWFSPDVTRLSAAGIFSKTAAERDSVAFRTINSKVDAANTTTFHFDELALPNYNSKRIEVGDVFRLARSGEIDDILNIITQVPATGLDTYTFATVRGDLTSPILASETINFELFPGSTVNSQGIVEKPISEIHPAPSIAYTRPIPANAPNVLGPDDTSFLNSSPRLGGEDIRAFQPFQLVTAPNNNIYMFAPLWTNDPTAGSGRLDPGENMRWITDGSPVSFVAIQANPMTLFWRSFEISPPGIETSLGTGVTSRTTLNHNRMLLLNNVVFSEFISSPNHGVNFDVNSVRAQATELILKSPHHLEAFPDVFGNSFNNTWINVTREYGVEAVPQLRTLLYSNFFDWFETDEVGRTVNATQLQGASISSTDAPANAEVLTYIETTDQNGITTGEWRPEPPGITLPRLTITTGDLIVETGDLELRTVLGVPLRTDASGKVEEDTAQYSWFIASTGRAGNTSVVTVTDVLGNTFPNITRIAYSNIQNAGINSDGSARSVWYEFIGLRLITVTEPGDTIPQQSFQVDPAGSFYSSNLDPTANGTILLDAF